jgi:hypothetical protein
MRFLKAGQLAAAFLFVCYLAVAGGILAQFSLSAHPHFLTQAESIDSQQAILDRRVFVFEGYPVNYTSWRSRVLIPFAIKALAAATGMRFGQSYLLVRWISATLMLAAFGLLAARQAGGGGWGAAAASGLLALVLFPTFLFLYETPSDFADALFFSLLVLLALEKRRWPFALVLLIGITNRESAIFALAVWLAVHFPESSRSGRIRELTYAAIVGALGCAVVLGLRLHFAVRASGGAAAGLDSTGQPYAWSNLRSAWQYLDDFFRRPSFTSSIFYLVGYMVFFPGLLWLNRQLLPAPIRRAAVAAGVIFLFSLPFAHFPEIRVYIPSLVIAVFATVVLLWRQMGLAHPAAPGRPHP